MHEQDKTGQRIILSFCVYCSVRVDHQGAYLDGDLRKVVGVAHGGSDEEFKVLAVLNTVISKLDKLNRILGEKCQEM